MPSEMVVSVGMPIAVWWVRLDSHAKPAAQQSSEVGQGAVAGSTGDDISLCTLRLQLLAELHGGLQSAIRWGRSSGLGLRTDLREFRSKREELRVAETPAHGPLDSVPGWPKALHILGERLRESYPEAEGIR